MNCRVYCVIVLVSLVPQALSMCFEPSYKTSQYHIEQYSTAPFILVGRVVETEQNRTHQAIKLNVSCVYKAPKNKSETMLRKNVTFTMPYRRICDPPLKRNQNYFFFFQEKVTTKKNRRRRKKKKNSASDFTRMSQQKKKYISLAAPIPVPEMDIMALERLVELTKDNDPVGHCYNVWSRWSPCTTKCGVGTMNRTYPRHQENRPNLQQLAVCHNAPCDQSRADTDYQYQPISFKNCKSMELVRVRWCTGPCKADQIQTAMSWEINPTLMLCTESDGTTQREFLRYYNVAIPSSCGCQSKDADPKYAVIGGPSSTNPDQSRSHRRHLPRLPAIFQEQFPEPETIELPGT